MIQVIKITKGGLNKPLIIANIYRPPKDLMIHTDNSPMN